MVFNFFFFSILGFKDGVGGRFYLSLENFTIFILQKEQCLLQTRFSAINKERIISLDLNLFIFLKSCFIASNALHTNNSCEKRQVTDSVFNSSPRIFRQEKPVSQMSKTGWNRPHSVIISSR